MVEIEQPQLYLITPPEFDPRDFATLLGQVLDSADVACVRLALATQDEEKICRAADALLEVSMARDVALVINEHILLVEKLGLDGVHLGDGARRIAKARKMLGDDAIVGAFSGTSRHDGMSAGEAGADYVSFGPIGAGALGDGTRASADLFKWWSEVIEVPIVAEGALDAEALREFAPMSDFIALGEEIWSAQDPIAKLAEIAKIIQA
ncbi:thiamine phosphate synthase [Planktotalea arctica]|uniref:thiamine phosphate synthase n=1 Tax=Planktotalea arctica TaxID=1481893 RepID=UPI000A1728E4|nr:thiamine phosphate synthase [Planktotalea arctica]